MIFTGMPTQVACTGGMSAAEPTSRALAWNASVTAGPPVILAHFTVNGSWLIQPVCSSTRSVVGSPITSVVPAGGGPAGSGASSDRPPAATSALRGPATTAMAAAVVIATLAITTAPKRVEGIGEDSAASPGN